MNYVVHPYMIQAILEGVLKSSQPGSHLKITKHFFFFFTPFMTGLGMFQHPIS